MSLPRTIEDLLRLSGLALSAIRSIVTSGAARIGIDIADAVRRVILAVDGAAAGDYTADQAALAIEELLAGLRANDERFDRELAEKFRDEGGSP